MQYGRDGRVQVGVTGYMRGKREAGGVFEIRREQLGQVETKNQIDGLTRAIPLTTSLTSSLPQGTGHS